jgi:hypothetical protein
MFKFSKAAKDMKMKNLLALLFIFFLVLIHL